MSEVLLLPAPSRAKLFLSSAIAALAVLAAMALVWHTQAKEPFTSSLELKDLTGTLANSTMKSFSLHVPQNGTLSLTVEMKRGGDFNAYFVRLDSGQADRPAKGLVIMNEFSAEHVSFLERRGAVPAGFYHLALINTAPSGPTDEPLVRIKALLEP